MPRHHAYYSHAQEQNGAPVNLYRLSTGDTVECTEVSTRGSNWADAVDLGELATEDFLASFVRRVRGEVRGWMR